LSKLVKRDTPRAGRVKLGLPWGTKPRLILCHLNAEALRQNSPVIEVEDSLSAFVKRIRGFDGGREIRVFKDQLSRLSVAIVRLATTYGDRPFQTNSQIVEDFERKCCNFENGDGGRRARKLAARSQAARSNSWSMN